MYDASFMNIFYEKNSLEIHVGISGFRSGSIALMIFIQVKGFLLIAMAFISDDFLINFVFVHLIICKCF